MSKQTVFCLVIFMFITACQTPTVAPQISPSITDTSTAETPPVTLEQPTNTQTLTNTPVIPTPSNTQLPTAEPPSSPTVAAPIITVAPQTPDGKAIIVDHTSVDLFEQIPDEYLERARNLGFVFMDASVGQNIHGALDCLTAISWSQAPAHCRRDYKDSSGNWTTFASGNAPARIQFAPDPTKYDRSRIIFEARPGDWKSYTQDFINIVAPQYLDSVTVLSYQFTYLMVVENSDINDPEKGFFVNNPDYYDIYDLENFIAQHPDKKFPLWTTSLSRNIGSQVATDFNDQMRQYAIQNGRILFDVADIESHTDQGEPCFDNRDGIKSCSNNGECEDHPDDGVQQPAICQDYTTEIEGGHLGSVSAGKLRIAKAMWVLLARIAGWEP